MPSHLESVLSNPYKENDMTVTPSILFRAAGAAAALAGLIFIGVQINHPYLDATSITSTDAMTRDSLKMLMAALALAGITGVYLHQVTKVGVLGMVGYVLFAAGYLSMLGTEFVAALVLPSIAHSSTAYVNDVIAVANNRPSTGDIGLMHPAILFTGITYIGGGFTFAFALFRANVVARWAAALLALGTLATIAVGLVPQYERLFAIPTGLALVALGYSLWRLQRAPAVPPVLSPVSPPLVAVGAK
jgi:hypothetical protein